jgi:hypothetical protein
MRTTGLVVLVAICLFAGSGCDEAEEPSAVGATPRSVETCLESDRALRKAAVGAAEGIENNVPVVREIFRKAGRPGKVILVEGDRVKAGPIFDQALRVLETNRRQLRRALSVGC